MFFVTKISSGLHLCRQDGLGSHKHYFMFSSHDFERLVFIHFNHVSPSFAFFRTHIPSIIVACFTAIRLSFLSYISFTLISSGKYRLKQVIREQPWKYQLTETFSFIVLFFLKLKSSTVCRQKFSSTNFEIYGGTLITLNLFLGFFLN